MKKCRHCGKEFDDRERFYRGYCHDCYTQWDSGFESTSEHAYQIGFDDLMEKLDKEWDDSFEKNIGEVFGDWGIGEWSCTKCGAVRINQEDAEKIKRVDAMTRIKLPCPNCKAKGFLKRKPPKKYFS